MLSRHTALVSRGCVRDIDTYIGTAGQRYDGRCNDRDESSLPVTRCRSHFGPELDVVISKLLSYRHVLEHSHRSTVQACVDQKVLTTAGTYKSMPNFVAISERSDKPILLRKTPNHWPTFGTAARTLTLRIIQTALERNVTVIHTGHVVCFLCLDATGQSTSKAK